MPGFHFCREDFPFDISPLKMPIPRYSDPESLPRRRDGGLIMAPAPPLGAGRRDDAIGAASKSRELNFAMLALALSADRRPFIYGRNDGGSSFARHLGVGYYPLGIMQYSYYASEAATRQQHMKLRFYLRMGLARPQNTGRAMLEAPAFQRPFACISRG